MTTLMTWQTSGGKRGRCDARCHNARKPKCKCVCHGVMHGKATGKTTQEFKLEAALRLDHLKDETYQLYKRGDITDFRIYPVQLDLNIK